MLKRVLREAVCYAAALAAICAAFAAAIWIGHQIYLARYFSTLPAYELTSEEERRTPCQLHQMANGPLLVNTANGSAQEVQIFPPLIIRNYVNDPFENGATIQFTNGIEERDVYGYMRSGGGTGWHFSAFPDQRYADVSIYKRALFAFSKEAAELHFCDECMAAIRELSPRSNFIIVDSYDNADMQFYDLKAVERGIDIRHYHLKMNEKNENVFRFTVSSSYFDGGKELDD